MKILSGFILFIVLVTSSFAENKIEIHADHEIEDSHSTEVTIHSKDHSHHESSKQSSPASDCQHYHVHCSFLCVGVLSSDFQKIRFPASFSFEVIFNIDSLQIKDFPQSVYRPPIS